MTSADLVFWARLAAIPLAALAVFLAWRAIHHANRAVHYANQAVEYAQAAAAIRRMRERDDAVPALRAYPEDRL